MTAAELEQRRRNVACLELLDASQRAHAAGDLAACRRHADEAAEAAPDVYAVVAGGMRIGEVPDPERDPAGWADYLADQRDMLARAEAEAAR